MLYAALQPEHEPQIVAFPCLSTSETWGRQVENMIHEALPFSLAAGEARGIGCWDDSGALVALIAYKPQRDPTEWRVPVLAVRRGTERQHNAITLKRLVVCLARASGALTLLSTVHCENGRMRWLNEKLGAVETPYPSAPKEYVVCTIAL